MKTFLLIFVTLIISQQLYVECGPHNPVARVSEAATASVRWLLQSVLNMPR